MKQLVLALSEKSVLMATTLNVAWIIGGLFYFFPAHFRKKIHGYEFQHGKIGTQPGNGALNDLPLCFFSQVLLANKYDFVIEIGAYTADRSIALRRNFPSVNIIAMDITADYARVSREHDIDLYPYSLESIRLIAKGLEGKGAILSHGTLCYMPIEQVSDLLQIANAYSLDIALVEPNAPGEESRTNSLMRAKDGSWFHPYIHLLKSAGFNLPINGGRQVGCSVSLFGEQVTYLYAHKLSSHPSAQSARIVAPADDAQ